jgi:hypothetical protein
VASSVPPATIRRAVMLIDVIVGSAALLFGVYLYCWFRSAALRERIERPKHEFLQQVQECDGSDGEHG